jgi:hypothetical protein
MAGIWTHQLLNALRQIGDPELDAATRGQPAWTRIPAMGNEDAKERKALAGTSGMAALLERWRASEHGALPGTAEARGPLDVFRVSPSAVDDPYWSTPARGIAPERIALARDLFVEFGGEIGATLLLASLPHAYASTVGASVLANTDELRSNTRRRIGETAQFVVEVLFPEPTTVYAAPALAAEAPAPPSDQGIPCGSTGYIRTRTTRLTHAVIRSIVSSVERVGADGVTAGGWDPQEPAGIPAFKRYEPTDDQGRPNPEADPAMVVRRGVPINQEDLLGTLATFTVTVFDVMELLGVAWSAEAEQAYLDLWNQVGELLGIGTGAVTDALAEAGVEVPEEYRGALRPRTPDEARALAELIKVRSWPLPLPGRVLGPFTGANGKILLRALLDELQAAMPRGMERLPLVAMRHLVDPRAHELLGLGGGGVLESLMRVPTPDRMGRRPARRRGRELVQAAMRLAANDISRRAFVYFIEQKALQPNRPQFRFAGIEQLVAPVPSGRFPAPGGAVGAPAPASGTALPTET